MKNSLFKLLGLVAFVVLSGVVHQASAQTCFAEMLSETGNVLSAKKGQVSVRSSADQAIVKVAKTGGRAKTDVRVYVDGQLRPSNLNFANGNYTTDYRTLTLNNVQGKNIMVQVDNKSVGHTFSYSVKIEGETRSLMRPAGLQEDKVLVNQKKTYYTRATCGNRVRVLMRETKPARSYGKIEISEQQNNGSWTLLENHTATGDQKIFVVDSDRPLKIEISYGGPWNIPGVAAYHYSINALSID
ncbi:MAG: hypothetical protein HLUCCX10_03410 [Algoriphagus marincola HL-49]|uniref:Uncharacterized protein n=1 Tax=Algoriphagus marincola HL-49 TaxID=1305737 RepID=A0A0P7YU87_9BACT|nr:MAG: hypothetical protein HLUCCX10_03410 [Algoriphagus marincola HL-49]